MRILTIVLVFISTNLMAEHISFIVSPHTSPNFENLYDKNRVNDLREENLFRGEIFGSLSSSNERAGGGGHKEFTSIGGGTDGKVSMASGSGGDH